MLTLSDPSVEKLKRFCITLRRQAKFNQRGDNKKSRFQGSHFLGAHGGQESTKTASATCGCLRRRRRRHRSLYSLDISVLCVRFGLWGAAFSLSILLMRCVVYKKLQRCSARRVYLCDAPYCRLCNLKGYPRPFNQTINAESSAAARQTVYYTGSPPSPCPLTVCVRERAQPECVRVRFGILQRTSWV